MEENSAAQSRQSLSSPEPSNQWIQARTLEGCFFYDKNDEIVGPVIAHNRVWEYFETEWIKTVVRPGDIVVDAGANLGWFTVVMARLVGTQGRVLAFEPEPRNFALLTKNVAWNSYMERCSLFRLALWEGDSTQELELSATNFGDHRVRLESPRLALSDKLNNEVSREKIAVQCSTLDTVISESGLENSTIRFFKMDTQGSEVSILRGAQHTLVRTQYLLTEYGPYSLKRIGHDADDFVSCLQEHFAEYSVFDKDGLTFQPLDKLRAELTEPSDVPCSEPMYVFRKNALPRE